MRPTTDCFGSRGGAAISERRGTAPPMPSGPRRHTHILSQPLFQVLLSRGSFLNAPLRPPPLGRHDVAARHNGVLAQVDTAGYGRVPGARACTSTATSPTAVVPENLGRRVPWWEVSGHGDDPVPSTSGTVFAAEQFVDPTDHFVNLSLYPVISNEQ